MAGRDEICPPRLDGPFRLDEDESSESRLGRFGSYFMVEKLTQYFRKFPGIGERQSERFVYFLLNSNPEYIKELSKLIATLKDSVTQCQFCFRFFPQPSCSAPSCPPLPETLQRTAGDDKRVCDVCTSNETDKTLLMVVEKDIDFESIRKSNTYNGRYFILNKLLPLLENKIDDKLRTKELLELIKRQTKDGLKEVILAFSLTPQGEHTDMYIRKLLTPFQKKYLFKVSTLGRGLSTGTELEYSDSDTIKNALKNRA